MQEAKLNYFITQDYEKYTHEHHAVWMLLFGRRMEKLRHTACREFLDGIDAIGLDQWKIPNLKETNLRLAPRTGWLSTPVSGYLPARDFFLCLSTRSFPTTVNIRSLKEIDYLEAPDIFHDVFGHVPMHAHEVFAEFLSKYGEVASRVTDEALLTELSRLFWFTVEFGLIEEGGKVKLLGSGLISSPGEGDHCLTDAVEKKPFDLEEVCATSFEIDHYQPKLFVLKSLVQLYDAMHEWERTRMKP